MFGFVFQGAAYEGLTCNAQEWVHSMGGGRIVELDGSIAINNPKAAAAHRAWPPAGSAPSRPRVC
jgi:trehalose/maltose transport system substrate-binding protein